MPSISINRLKQIIREELNRAGINEGAEQNAAALDHAKKANDLLAAIEKYKGVATSKSMGNIQSELEKIEKTLERVAAQPLQYADPVPTEEPDDEGGLLSPEPSKTSSSQGSSDITGQKKQTKSIPMSVKR